MLRNTINLIKKIFPIRQRPLPLYKNRTCLNYDIGRCPGVCQKLISSHEYKKIINEICMIFEGRTDTLKDYLVNKMINHSNNMEYEKAAFVRDQIKAIDRLVESQKVSLTNSTITRDVIGISTDHKLSSVQIFQIRSGRLVGRLGYIYDSPDIEDELIVQKVIEEHYSLIEKVEMPPEILIPKQIPHIDFISEWLSTLANKKVKVSIPKKSDKAKLINLVNTNASLELLKVKQGQEKNLLEIEDLAQILQLDHPPRRIEGYDISHIQGSNAVASQVVFVNGIPAKQHYRKYIIKDSTIKTGYNDDYLALKEVITRRFKRWSQYKKDGLDINNLRNKKFSSLGPQDISDWPDLVVIDGGKGQLNAVKNAFKELGLLDDINFCSIAKKKEEIFVPASSKALDTHIDQLGLLLIRRLRDEAHRFAINFHRKKRTISMKRSHLIEIPGVGAKRIKSLLSHFNSIQAIQIASKEEIATAPLIGKETAFIIWKYFHSE